jgi:hypothetical protein
LRRISLSKDKFGSIQWVIDALYTEVKDKTHRRPRETDEIRADRNLSWCPLIGICLGVLNARKNGICLREDYGLPLILNSGRKKYVQNAIPLQSREW